MKKLSKLLFLFTGLLTIGLTTGVAYGATSFSSIEKADATGNTISVYFQDKFNWKSSGHLYCHYWGGSSSTTWPGTETTQVYKSNDGYNIFKADIPSDTTGLIFNANLKVGEEDKWKTKNIEDEIEDTACFYPSDGDASWYIVPIGKFNVSRYTVKFHGNGNTSGTMSDQICYNYNDTGNWGLYANSFEKTGYTFGCWTTNSDGTGTKYSNQGLVPSGTVPSNGTLDLYAQWEKNIDGYYIIGSFNNWKCSDDWKLSLKAGSNTEFEGTFTLPQDKSTFKSEFLVAYYETNEQKNVWGMDQLANDTGTARNFGQLAQGSENQNIKVVTGGDYKVIFHSDDGSDKIYIPGICTVSYNMKGHGAQISSIIGYYGDKISAPTSPEDSYYNFDGWYKDNTCQTPWDFNESTIDAQNITLHAKWLPKTSNTMHVYANVGKQWISHNTTYDQVKGHYYATLTGVDAEGAIMASNKPIEAGTYENISAYSLNVSEFSKDYTAKTVADPTTGVLYPHVTYAGNYIVDVKLDGTYTLHPLPSSFKIKIGEEMCVLSEVDGIIPDEDRDRGVTKLYTNLGRIPVTAGQSVEAYIDDRKIVSWTADTLTTNNLKSDKTIQNDASCKIYLKYIGQDGHDNEGDFLLWMSGQQYTIDYPKDERYLSEGAKTNGKNYEHNLGITLPKDDGSEYSVHRNGYNFAGWHFMEDCSDDAFYSFSDQIYGNKSIYAKWEEDANYVDAIWKNGDIVLEKDRVEINNEMPQYHGETPSKESTPEYSYTFTGWDPTPGYISQNTTYNAVFSESIRYYTVTFNRGSGTGGTSSLSLSYNQSLPSIDIPTAPEGKKFEGYYSENNGQGKKYYDLNGNPIDSPVCTGDLNLYAYYKDLVTVTTGIKSGTTFIIQDNIQGSKNWSSDGAKVAVYFKNPVGGFIDDFAWTETYATMEGNVYSVTVPQLNNVDVKWTNVELVRFSSSAPDQPGWHKDYIYNYCELGDVTQDYFNGAELVNWGDHDYCTGHYILYSNAGVLSNKGFYLNVSKDLGGGQKWTDWNAKFAAVFVNAIGIDNDAYAWTDFFTLVDNGVSIADKNTYFETSVPTYNGNNVQWGGVIVYRFKDSTTSIPTVKEPDSNVYWNKTQMFGYNETNQNRQYVEIIDWNEGSLKIDFTDANRADIYGNYLLSQCAICDAKGNTDIDKLKSSWSNSKEEYLVMADYAQGEFWKAKADEYSDLFREKAAARYDYIVDKYSSSVPSIDDFANRNDEKSGKHTTVNAARHNYLLSETEDQTVLIVVVAASVTLFATSSALLLLLKKKKKTESK